MKPQLSLKVLQSLGVEFWLPLPLLGLAFWLGTGFVGERILTRPLEINKSLSIDSQSARQLTQTLIAITAEIIPKQGFSRVIITTNNSTLKKIEFEFPVTDPNALQVAISQELGLPPTQVKKLIRYQY